MRAPSPRSPHPPINHRRVFWKCISAKSDSFSTSVFLLQKSSSEPGCPDSGLYLYHHHHHHHWILRNRRTVIIVTITITATPLEGFVGEAHGDRGLPAARCILIDHREMHKCTNMRTKCKPHATHSTLSVSRLCRIYYFPAGGWWGCITNTKHLNSVIWLRLNYRSEMWWWATRAEVSWAEVF